MLAVHCPEHDALVLLTLLDLEELRHTSGGIEVHYRCNCGHAGTWLTGRASRRKNR